MRLLLCLVLNSSAIALLLVWFFDHNQLWANASALFAAIGGFALGFYVDKD
jgi:hypothetical protein